MKRIGILFLSALIALFGLCSFAGCAPEKEEGNEGGENPKTYAYTDGCFFMETPGTASSQVYLVLHKDGSYYKDAFGTPSVGEYSVDEANGKITLDGVEYTFDKKAYQQNGKDFANAEGYWVIHGYDYAGWPVDYVQKPTLTVEEKGVTVGQYWDPADESGNSYVILKSDKSFTYISLDENNDPVIDLGTWTKSDSVYTLKGASITYTLTVGSTITLTYGEVSLTMTDKDPSAAATMFVMTGNGSGDNSWDSATLTVLSNGTCTLTTTATMQSIKGTWTESGNNLIITWETGSTASSETLTLTGTANAAGTKIDYVTELSLTIPQLGTVTYPLQATYFTEDYVPVAVARLAGSPTDPAQSWDGATLELFDNGTCKLATSATQQSFTGTWIRNENDVVVTWSAGSTASESTLTLAGTVGATAGKISLRGELTLNLGDFGTFVYPLTGDYFTSDYVPQVMVSLTGTPEDAGQSWAVAEFQVFDNYTCHFGQATLQQNFDGTWSYSGKDIVVSLNGQIFTLKATEKEGTVTYASETAFELDLGSYGVFSFKFA